MRRALLAAFAWLAICLVVVLLITSCGGPKEGYVYTKRIVPAMDWVWLEPIYVGKTVVLVPVNEHSDECPELTLKPDPSKSKTTTVCVDHTTYDNTAIGSFYQEVQK